jgi:hypothetical protein
MFKRALGIAFGLALAPFVFLLVCYLLVTAGIAVHDLRAHMNSPQRECVAIDAYHCKWVTRP